jgi:ATP-dependent 26S proteasome regulatory subunit
MSDDLEAANIWGDSNDQQGHDPSSSSSQEDTRQQQGQQPQQEPSMEESKEDEDTITMTITDLRQRIRLLDNDIRVMKSDIQRISHESRAQKERIRDNIEKVKLNKQLPYLVGNVIEILEPNAEDGECVCVSV